MDATTAELRRAHDALAELYADRLANALDRRPVDRAVLGLFCSLLVDCNDGTAVGDIGCGSGRLAPFLVAHGLEPHGVDLSPEMVRVARRDHPGIPFDVADMGASRSPTPRWLASCAGTRSCTSRHRTGHAHSESWRGWCDPAVTS